MLSPNRLLLNEILKRTFNFFITIVNARGEEREIFLKKKKKDFLKRLGTIDIRVVLVDNFPSRDNWEFGVFYLTRNGLSLYYKEFESKSIEL